MYVLMGGLNIVKGSVSFNFENEKMEALFASILSSFYFLEIASRLPDIVVSLQFSSNHCECFRELDPADKFVIICSDGVFEFLTNQMVADECARHSEPLLACKAVVAQAYHLWLQYEVRTDDITMIAIFIDDIPQAAVFSPSTSFYTKVDGGGSGAGGTAVTVPTSASNNANGRSSPPLVGRQASLDIGEQRPVRRVMSREKRKIMIELRSEAQEDEDEEDITEAEMKALMVPKSDADAELISTAIKSNFLFQHLNATQRTAVINVMKEVNVKAGDRIIRQGDKGDRFYVVNTGRFEVRVRPPAVVPAEEVAKEAALKEHGVREKSFSIISVDRSPSASAITYEPNVSALGNVVHVYESSVNSHPGFGELSLM